MKKIQIGVAMLSVLLAACGGGVKKENDKVKLAFQPGSGKAFKMVYEFSVEATGDKPRYVIELSGTASKKDEGEVVLSTTNDKIYMDGSIGGKEVKFTAGTSDSIPQDVAMAVAPVFSLLNKKFETTYDLHLNKLSEVMVREGGVDSTSNKMQFFVRYPDSAVGVGESWEKEILLEPNGKKDFSAKYTLKEVKDGMATITVDGKLTGKGENFGHEFSLEGTVTGTVKVDIATGWPVDTDLSQDFTLDLGGKKSQIKYHVKSTVTQ